MNPPDEPQPGQFKWGPFFVIVSIDAGRWHMSISHRKRDLTYDELKRARYKFCPEHLPMAMILPDPAVFVNVHQHAFHFWEIKDDFPEWTKPLTDEDLKLNAIFSKPKP
jgi:hypothetical protein